MGQILESLDVEKVNKNSSMVDTARVNADLQTETPAVARILAFFYVIIGVLSFFLIFVGGYYIHSDHPFPLFYNVLASVISPLFFAFLFFKSKFKLALIFSILFFLFNWAIFVPIKYFISEEFLNCGFDVGRPVCNFGYTFWFKLFSVAGIIFAIVSVLVALYGLLRKIRSKSVSIFLMLLLLVPFLLITVATAAGLEFNKKESEKTIQLRSQVSVGGWNEELIILPTGVRRIKITSKITLPLDRENYSFYAEINPIKVSMGGDVGDNPTLSVTVDSNFFPPNLNLARGGIAVVDISGGSHQVALEIEPRKGWKKLGREEMFTGPFTTNYSIRESGGDYFHPKPDLLAEIYRTKTYPLSEFEKNL